MASWKDNLRKASFRDVPFEVEEDQGKFGRRVQTHEFPQRDKPYTEDLGRATRRFTVTGFVLGDDYMQRRDALLSALEQSGPGPLVHPWLGSLQVNVEEVTASHSRSDGGVCRFHITFVEAGELAFPAASESQGARAQQAADKLQKVADASFTERFSLKGSSVISEGALKDLNGALTTIEQNLGGMSHLLANPVKAFRDKFPLPQDLQVPGLVTEVRGLYQHGSSVLDVGKGLAATIGGGGVHSLNANSVLALTRISSALGKSVKPSAGRAAVSDTAKSPAAQRQDNLSELAGYLQRTTLAQAAGMASTMPMPVHDDGVQVRDAVTAALDEASVSATDDVYQALQDVRTAVHADITARLAGSQRLMAYEPRENVPAVVVAYDRYEDVDREQEIVERNAIRHPGFVPARPLLVLTT